MAVHPPTLVPFGETWEKVCGLKSKRFGKRNLHEKNEAREWVYLGKVSLKGHLMRYGNPEFGLA